MVQREILKQIQSRAEGIRGGHVGGPQLIPKNETTPFLTEGSAFCILPVVSSNNAQDKADDSGSNARSCCGWPPSTTEKRSLVSPSIKRPCWSCTRVRDGAGLDGQANQFQVRVERSQNDVQVLRRSALDLLSEAEKLGKFAPGQPGEHMKIRIDG